MQIPNMDKINSPFLVRKSHTVASNGNITYSFRIIKNDDSFVVEKCVATIVERKVSVELTYKLFDEPHVAIATSAIEYNNVYHISTQQLETIHNDYVFLVVLQNKSQTIKSLFMRMAFNKMKNNMKTRTLSEGTLSDAENEVVDTLLGFSKCDDNTVQVNKNKMPRLLTQELLRLPTHALFGNISERSNLSLVGKRREQNVSVPASPPASVEEDGLLCLPKYVESFPKRFDFYFPIAPDVNDADIELMKTTPEITIIHHEKENHNHVILTYNTNANIFPTVLNYLIPIRLEGEDNGIVSHYDEKTKCNVLVCYTTKQYQIPRANRTSNFSTYLDEITNEHFNVHDVTMCNFKADSHYTYEYDKETGTLLFIAHQSAPKCHFGGKFSDIKYRISVEIGKVKEIKSIVMEEKITGGNSTRTIAKIVCLEDFDVKFDIPHSRLNYMQIQAKVTASYKLASFNFVEQKGNQLLFSFTMIDSNKRSVSIEQTHELKCDEQKWVIPIDNSTKIQYINDIYKCSMSFNILRDVQKTNARKNPENCDENNVAKKKPRNEQRDTTALYIPPPNQNQLQLLQNLANGTLSHASRLTGITQMHPTNETLSQSRVDASNKLFALDENKAIYSFCKGIFTNANVNFPTHMNAFDFPPTTVMMNGNIHIRGVLSKHLSALYGGIQHVKSYLRGCSLHVSIQYKKHFINNVFLLDKINHIELYEMAELCKHETFEYVVIIKPFSSSKMPDVANVFATNPVTP